MPIRRLIWVCLIGLAAPLLAQEALSVQAPRIVLRGVPFDITVGAGGDSAVVTAQGTILAHTDVRADGSSTLISDVVLPLRGQLTLSVNLDGQTGSVTVYSLPAFVSILPPLMAIALAMLTRQVILSLFSGVWLGAILTLGGSLNPVTGFLRTLDTYMIRALTDTSHMSIVLFTMILGGMVGVLSRSGGTQGIVRAMARRANTRMMGQLGTWFLGIMIFFDDYSNALLVGNTMRPFTDKLKISREKLAYLVDSTSAPIASIALASTWIGFELGLINSSYQSLGISHSAYETFWFAIPYSFYSFMALLMVVLIAVSGRDYGPMLKAERRAIIEGKVLRDGAKPLQDKELAGLLPPEGVEGHWLSAILPITTMVAVLAIGLYVNGTSALGAGQYQLRDIVGAADSFVVLIWASASGAAVAGIVAVVSRVLSVGETVDAFLVGFRAMLLGVMILTLARGLQLVATDLNTAGYIFHLTADILDPRFLPALTFVIAAAISFSTGTSFGTMAILVPVVIPLAYHMPGAGGIDSPILLGSVGAILSGAIFGDHCSPISDTTVLSSIATGADHIDHVRTQLPYGLTIAGVTLTVGYMPAGFGMNPWLGNLLALSILAGIVWKFGRRPD